MFSTGGVQESSATISASAEKSSSRLQGYGRAVGVRLLTSRLIFIKELRDVKEEYISYVCQN